MFCPWSSGRSFTSWSSWRGFVFPVGPGEVLPLVLWEKFYLVLWSFTSSCRRCFTPWSSWRGLPVFPVGPPERFCPRSSGEVLPLVLWVKFYLVLLEGFCPFFLLVLRRRFYLFSSGEVLPLVLLERFYPWSSGRSFTCFSYGEVLPAGPLGGFYLQFFLLVL